MTEITLSELKQRRKTLEADVTQCVHALVEQFDIDTGTRVKSVVFVTNMIGGLCGADIKLDLEI